MRISRNQLPDCGRRAGFDGLSFPRHSPALMSAGQKKGRSCFFDSRLWRASDDGAFGGGLSNPYQGGIKRASASYFFLFLFLFARHIRASHAFKLRKLQEVIEWKNLANGIEFVLIFD